MTRPRGRGRSCRVPLHERVDADTCILLERAGPAGAESGGAEDGRAALTLTVPERCRQAIADVTLLSEFGRCQLFGDGGEYLATAAGTLVEEVEDTRVWSLQHTCRPPVTELTLQCVSPAGRRQLWVYALEVTLVSVLPRSGGGGGFSLDAALARVDAADTPLSAGAAALRSALQGAPSAPSAAALAALFAQRPPSEPSGGRAGKEKLPCETAGGGSAPEETLSVRLEGGAAGGEGAVPAWAAAVVGLCVGQLEERLWQRIAPRLNRIEQRQQEILDRIEQRQQEILDRIEQRQQEILDRLGSLEVAPDA